MPLFGLLIQLAAHILERTGGLVQRLALLLHGLLPALLTPDELARLTQRHYQRSYSSTVTAPVDEPHFCELEPWEREVADRHSLAHGRLLALGAGLGREAFAMARRGLSVVGIDTDATALAAAAYAARILGHSIQFVRADLRALPFRPTSFDAALLASAMYSAIPGKAQRQMWLHDLFRVLAPEGLAVLSFLTEQKPQARMTRLREALARRLARLPGANPAYQPGDTCPHGHFLHAFQTEQEVRQELEETGVLIRELDWKRGFAVVAKK
ncbi:MAG TPA: class I SAM-dependent methyltransferase [Nitrospiraceae bacterium]|nr:class I SAM-dependent methyltransferase [Nitrospiraceae bacterium]